MRLFYLFCYKVRESRINRFQTVWKDSFFVFFFNIIDGIYFSMRAAILFIETLTNYSIIFNNYAANFHTGFYIKFSFRARDIALAMKKFSFIAQFFYFFAKFIWILKTSINRGKSNKSNFIQFFKMPHYRFTHLF